MEIPFKQAKFFFVPPGARRVDIVVLHAAEVAPSSRGAEWLLDYCANNDRVASWHYAVDDDSVTQSVREADVAYHAPGANRNGIGVELATRGKPDAAAWADPYHRKMLDLAAWLVAGICRRHKIDPFLVDAAGLKEGRRGITTHAQVSLAFGKSTHDDPGPDFPAQAFVDRLRARLDTGNLQIEGQA